MTEEDKALIRKADAEAAELDRVTVARMTSMVEVGLEELLTKVNAEVGIHKKWILAEIVAIATAAYRAS